MGKLEAIVAETVDAGLVPEVRILREQDADGQRWARFYVVFDEARGQLSSDDMTRISDRIWAEMLEDAEGDLPVISFISSADDRKLTSP